MNGAHCTDETLLAYLDGELGRLARRRTERHLGACWSCRGRKAELEAQAEDVTRRLASAVGRSTFPGPGRIAEAQRRFDVQQAQLETERAALGEVRRGRLAFSLRPLGVAAVAIGRTFRGRRLAYACALSLGVLLLTSPAAVVSAAERIGRTMWTWASTLLQPKTLSPPPPRAVAGSSPAAPPQVRPISPPPALPSPALSVLRLEELELLASYRIHRLSECLGGPATLSRDARGQLAVGASLVSEACRAAAERDFASLSNEPGVSVELSVVEPSRPVAGDPAIALPADAPLQAIPAYPELYEFYSRQALRDPQGGVRDVDAAVAPLVRQLVRWTLARSGRAVGYSRELQRLASRWPPRTLGRLGLDATSMWRAMVRDHARGLEQDTELLLAQLQPALGLPLDEGDEPLPPLRRLGDLPGAVSELSRLAESNDVRLRGLLTPAAGAGPVPDRAGLSRNLRRTVRLASRFAEPWYLQP